MAINYGKGKNTSNYNLNRSVVLDVELLGGNYCMKYLGHKFYLGHFALLVTLERVHKTPLLAQKSAR